MYYIEKGLKPRQLSLFLTKPNKNRTTIAKLTHAYNKKLSVKFGNVNELSFTLPYSITIKNKIVRNPYIDEIKEKYFIRAEFGDSIEYFLINKLSKSSGDTDELNVQCFSLGYQLRYQRMIDYQATSYNCLQVLTDCLKGTGWTVGYINVDFNLKFRQFDVSSKTKLDFLYEIAETFEGVVDFDTVEKKINIYKEEEISKYKGFWIKYGKYLENVEETIDSDEIVTRLYVKGGDNLSINAVNPTGQPYIDDFSYFLYPFQMDNEGNVTSHSNHMPDELCIALINYNAYVTSRKDEFKSLLDRKKAKQEEKTQRENELNQLNIDLQIILDAIQVAKDTKQSTKDLISKRDTKIKEIEGKKKVISEIDSTIKSIDNSITALKDDLKMENHLSPNEMDELTNYIQVDEWSDENKIDENDLYEDALKKIGEINSPPINISVGIINFFEIVEEQRNWDRLNIGDIVKIKHDKLNIFVQTKITQIDYDFESASINLTISNSKKIKSTLEKINDAIYKIGRVNTEFNNRKIDWNKAAYNFNLRNDRISETPTTPTITGITHKENDNGSVNLTVNWDYPDFNKTNKNEDNIDGFLIYLHADQSNETYMFGSKMASETKVDVTYGTKTYTFPSVPSNLFYTIGVRAYRRVDEDISSDGILLSDIATSSKSSENPYQPSVYVNVNARLNGVKYTVSKTEPSNPQIDDVWANPEDAKIRIWNGTEWKIDKSVEQSKEYTDKVINESKGQLQKEIEDAMKEVDEAMLRVDAEMDRIKNEVIPEVEKTIKETYIPNQSTPPIPVPESGLWWDTSVNPPRLKKFNPQMNEWNPIAPTDKEVDDLITATENDIKNNIVSYVNISPEQIKIGANKISVEGVVSYINNDGTTGTLINGSRLISGSVTTKQLDANEIFANSAIIGQIQTYSVKTCKLDATQIVTGTLDALKVSVVNLSASNIIAGEIDASKILVKNLSASNIISGTLKSIDIQGSVIMSSDGNTSFTVAGGAIQLNDSSGNKLLINSDSLYGYNSSGTLKFRMDKLLITSAALGTSNSNVYLAPDSNNEARVVDVESIPSDGLPESYSYRPIRALGYRFAPNANGYIGTDGEIRLTSIGFTQTDGSVIYRNARANGYYGDFIEVNKGSYIYARGTELQVTAPGSLTSYNPVRCQGVITGFTNLYLQGNEIRCVNSSSSTWGSSHTYSTLRAGYLFADALDVNGSGATNVYIRPRSNGEVVISTTGSTTSYRPIRASNFITDTSLRENKKDIEIYSENVLDVFRNLNAYTYLRKSDSPDAFRQLGLMIDETPRILHGEAGNSFELYALSSFIAKGLKDHIEDTDNMKFELNESKAKIEQLLLEKAELENRISVLEQKLGV